MVYAGVPQHVELEPVGCKVVGHPQQRAYPATRPVVNVDRGEQRCAIVGNFPFVVAEVTCHDREITFLKLFCVLGRGERVSEFGNSLVEHRIARPDSQIFRNDQDEFG